jgi:hypothetical protein
MKNIFIIYIYVIYFGAVGPEIETFLGPEMATSAASAILAQKGRFLYMYSTLLVDYCQYGNVVISFGFFMSYDLR